MHVAGWASNERGVVGPRVRENVALDCFGCEWDLGHGPAVPIHTTILLDDIAQSTGLFMSPDTYREVIKPHHARIIKAIKDNGMIPEQHTCGKFEAVIEDYMEIGIESLYPAQPTNDLAAIQREYGDRCVICGGFDSQGPAGQENADEETTRAEARRMAREYAVNSNSFICLPLIGDGQSEPTPQEAVRLGWFIEEFRKECAALGLAG